MSAMLEAANVNRQMNAPTAFATPTWSDRVAEAHRAQSSGAAAAQGCCNVLGVAGQHLGQRAGILSALCLHVERDCHGRAGAGNPGQGGQGCRSRSRGPC